MICAMDTVAPPHLCTLRTAFRFKTGRPNSLYHYQSLKSLKHVPPINYGGNRAFYRPLEDFIQIPSLISFNESDEYYNTHFHEIIHSTGHTSRLARLEKDAFLGNHEYSKEELVAEMGACFLCGISGIETTKDNSVAYIQGWLKKLKSDPKFVVQAAGKAQKAVDYLLDIKHEN